MLSTLVRWLAAACDAAAARPLADTMMPLACGAAGCSSPDGAA
jgi:hypothetical protein